MAERTLYRAVHTNPPTVRDFLSNVALGRRLRPEMDTPVTRRLWAGLSTFDTEAALRERMTETPQVGGFVAVLRIPDGATLVIEQTSRNRHHYTIWGEPTAVMACITEIR